MDWNDSCSMAVPALPGAPARCTAVGTAGPTAAAGLQPYGIKSDPTEKAGGRAACAVIR